MLISYGPVFTVPQEYAEMYKQDKYEGLTQLIAFLEEKMRD
jgi:hypothetical protein